MAQIWKIQTMITSLKQVAWEKLIEISSGSYNNLNSYYSTNNFLCNTQSWEIYSFLWITWNGQIWVNWRGRIKANAEMETKRCSPKLTVVPEEWRWEKVWDSGRYAFSGPKLSCLRNCHIIWPNPAFTSETSWKRLYTEEWKLSLSSMPGRKWRHWACLSSFTLPNLAFPTLFQYFFKPKKTLQQ